FRPGTTDWSSREPVSFTTAAVEEGAEVCDPRSISGRVWSAQSARVRPPVGSYVRSTTSNGLNRSSHSRLTGDISSAMLNRWAHGRDSTFGKGSDGSTPRPFAESAHWPRLTDFGDGRGRSTGRRADRRDRSDPSAGPRKRVTDDVVAWGSVGNGN